MKSKSRRRSLVPCKPGLIRRKTPPRRCLRRTSPAGKRVLASRKASRSQVRRCSPKKNLPPCPPGYVRRSREPRSCFSVDSTTGKRILAAQKRWQTSPDFVVYVDPISQMVCAEVPEKSTFIDPSTGSVCVDVPTKLIENAFCDNMFGDV